MTTNTASPITPDHLAALREIHEQAQPGPHTVHSATLRALARRGLVTLERIGTGRGAYTRATLTDTALATLTESTEDPAAATTHLGFPDLAVRAGLAVGDRITAHRAHGVIGSPADRDFHNVTGTITKLMGAAVAFQADVPYQGYLMFAEVVDVEKGAAPVDGSARAGRCALCNRDITIDEVALTCDGRSMSYGPHLLVDEARTAEAVRDEAELENRYRDAIAEPAPACDMPDGCGAPAGQPCEPGCPSLATDEAADRETAIDDEPTGLDLLGSDDEEEGLSWDEAFDRLGVEPRPTDPYAARFPVGATVRVYGDYTAEVVGYQDGRVVVTRPGGSTRRIAPAGLDLIAAPDPVAGTFLAADAPLGTIRFRRNAGQAPACPCGNTTHDDGFRTITVAQSADGPVGVFIDPDGAWHALGRHVVCLTDFCLRVWSERDIVTDGTGMWAPVTMRLHHVAEPEAD